MLLLSGMMFGLAKNEWTSAPAELQDMDVVPYWMVFRGVGDPSLFLVFAAIVSSTLWGPKALGKAASVLGVLFAIPVGVGMNIPAFCLITILWGMLWTFVVTALLW